LCGGVVYQLEARIQSADDQMRPSICWGGSTWVFVVDGRRFVRVRDIVQVRVT